MSPDNAPHSNGPRVAPPARERGRKQPFELRYWGSAFARSQLYSGNVRYLHYSKMQSDAARPAPLICWL
jgi:hypothetical protein